MQQCVHLLRALHEHEDVLEFAPGGLDGALHVVLLPAVADEGGDGRLHRVLVGVGDVLLVVRYAAELRDDGDP